MIRYYYDTDYDEVKNILQSGGNFDAVWDSRDHWAKKIEKDPTSIFIAEGGDEVIGCIMILRDPWGTFLFRLAVKESHRKKGVGTQLILAAEDQLRKEGVDEVALFVDEENAELQGYYQRRGYLRGGHFRCMYKKL